MLIVWLNYGDLTSNNNHLHNTPINLGNLLHGTILLIRIIVLGLDHRFMVHITCKFDLRWWTHYIKQMVTYAHQACIITQNKKTQCCVNMCKAKLFVTTTLTSTRFFCNFHWFPSRPIDREIKNYMVVICCRRWSCISLKNFETIVWIIINCVDD
jgi:hypothetical protein